MNIEGLGIFYLGRKYNPSKKQSDPEQPVLYDAKDLVTHGVCVGMTGSGKTGLCLGIIEEAALDGIPSLIIDPKGDLSNLLLTFPNLAPQDFAPWVNLDEAAHKGIPAADYPANQATLWRNGLAQWGQSGERIQRLRDAAEFTIYTPGSSAGVPISVLKSFDAPQGAAAEDNELFLERVQSTATSLLGLIGLDADPVQSREHILLANLLQAAWKQSRNLDVATLVHQVQLPPFDHVGALELEAFYPSKDRIKLAMQLNNLLAAPGFASWIDGVPLDISSFLRTPAGKPRVAIFSIAHLSDAERMFFVSLLLNQTVAWMRQQPGTTSLRALLYMDEIFGYFPPVANPPSKQPLLTLMKQARAAGLGVLLATQNPVDLDYKGLSNAGTWLIGRLQTERDKARVLEGLEGVASAAGSQFDTARMGQTLAGLGSRVFLMNNVHDQDQTLLESRWTMSYLRGPLTRDQIKILMDPAKAASPAVPAPAQAAAPGEKQVLGLATIRYAQSGINQDVEVAYLAPVDGNTNAPDWTEATDMNGQPREGDPVPPALAKDWQRAFTTWLANNEKVDLFQSARFKETSQPGQSQADFRAHVEQRLREERDAEVAALRTRYAGQIATLEDRIRRAGATVAQQQGQATSAKISAALSVGSAILGAFLGKKAVSVTEINKVATAGRAATRAWNESHDVTQATGSVASLQQQLDELKGRIETEVKALQDSFDPAKEPINALTLRPKKTGVIVKSLLLRIV